MIKSKSFLGTLLLLTLLFITSVAILPTQAREVEHSVAKINVKVKEKQPTQVEICPATAQINTDRSSERLIGSVESSTKLEQDDLLLAQLRQSNAISIFETVGENQFGELIWEEAVLMDYYGVKVSAILVPATNDAAAMNEGNTSATLIAYFHEDWDDFRTLVMETTSNGATEEAEPIWGVSAYTTGAELISGATYQGDELLAIQQGTSGVDWDCVMDCLINTWSELPWWARRACRASCNSCLGGSPYGCAVCVGCLAGYAAACLNYCESSPSPTATPPPPPPTATPTPQPTAVPPPCSPTVCPVDAPS